MSAQGNRRGSIIKIALTAAAGATIEWYDFFVYGTAAALVFPHLFFPATLSPFVAQLAAFSTFAVGFLARPFGGMIFGHFGDLYGRKRALVVALLAMGSGTTLIGILPGYAAIGAAAPLLLVILRFLQGLAIGGQWGGAALLAIESSPENRRGFYGSFAQIGVPAGVVLANIVFLILSAKLAPSAFEAWGWRLPFLLSILLVVVGIYIQLHLEESVEFSGNAEEEGPARKRPSLPVLSAILHHPRQIILAGGAFVANNICFYVAITYAIAYWTSTLHQPKPLILSAVMIGGIVMVPALIICGRLSDSWGRLGIFMVGAALSGIWSLLFFPLLETGSPTIVIYDITVGLVLLSLMYGPQAALFAELFPVEVRYSGASLGYQLGSVVGGGLAPIIATALFEQFKTTHAIALYMAAACAVSFYCTYLLSRSTGGLKRTS